jgi:glycosyltransferase involved in cell wall biosynthesis
MEISFCHHLSLKYVGGGEKWIINTAKEMQKRGHDVKVYALPFVLKGKTNPDQIKLLGDIPYKESYFHKVKSDLAYVTYHPFARCSFRIKGPKIAGIHSQVYDASVKPYGTLPTLAKECNKLFGLSDLNRYDAVHYVSPLTNVKHPWTFFIPNFVDSTVYHPYPKPEEYTIAFASRHVWQKGYDIWESLKPRLGNIAVLKESGSLAESEMPQFLGTAHLIINCSRVDTFGISLVESLMCGTPVVSSGLTTHRALNVPLHYAETLDDYVQVCAVEKAKWNCYRTLYDKDCDLIRKDALAYDTKNVANHLEKMFLEVYRYAQRKNN